MKHALFTSCIIAFTFINCTHKITVSKLNGKSNLKETFFYSLPRNTIDIELKIKATTLKRDNKVKWDDSCIKFLSKKYELDADEIKKIVDKTKAEEYVIEKDGIIMSLEQNLIQKRYTLFMFIPHFLPTML